MSLTVFLVSQEGLFSVPKDAASEPGFFQKNGYETSEKLQHSCFKLVFYLKFVGWNLVFFKSSQKLKFFPLFIVLVSQFHYLSCKFQKNQKLCSKCIVM